MKLSSTKEQVETPTQPADRRWVLEWCTVCRAQQDTLIYFQNSKRCCNRYATKVPSTVGTCSADRCGTGVQFP
jgi:hypothetical protein